jgi:PST family polysaccharide transporter
LPAVKLALNAAALSLARIGTNFLSFLLLLAIARELGPAGAGIYSFAFAVATLASVAIGLGADDFGVREFARLEAGARVSLLARLLGAHTCVALLAAPAIAGVIASTAIGRAAAWPIAMLAVYQASFAVARSLFVPAFAREAMVGPAIAELACRGSANLIALVLVAGCGAGLAEALAVFPVAGILLLCRAWRSAREQGAQPRFRARAAEITAMLRALSGFLTGGLLTELYPRVGTLLLPLLASQAEAGYFATPAKFVEVGLLPAYFLGLSAYPRLATQFYGDRRAFAASARSLAVGSAALGVLVALAMLFALPALLVPAFGAEFEPALPCLRWLALVALIDCLELAGARVVMAADRNRARLALLCAGLVLQFAFGLFAIPKVGAIGAVIGWSLSLVPVVVGYALVVRGALRN